MLVKKKAEFIVNRNLKQNNNVLKLINRSNFLASNRRSEADEIIQPFITAILDYDEAFNKNCSQALGLADQVAENDPVAMASFRTCLDDISTNIEHIEKVGNTSKSELDTLCKETFQEIRDLATQIQELELQRVSLETEINFLREDIIALELQLMQLEYDYWLCYIIVLIPLGCQSIVSTIQIVTSQKQKKTQELFNKTSELTQLNARLTQLNQDKQSLEADYNASNIALVEINSITKKCSVMLNNIKGIEALLENINTDITILLKIQLNALQQDWNDLVDEAKLFSSALQLN